MPIQLSHKRPFSQKNTSQTTRSQIVEVAGQTFGEMGFERTTGKEITTRAGCNSAAINYHFGGMDELYCEVLLEAHKRFVTTEELIRISESQEDIEKRLLGVIHLFTRLTLDPSAEIWPLQIVGREILAPSRFFDMLKRELLPKQNLALRLVAEYLDLPVEHPVSGVALVSFIGPYIMLLIGTNSILTRFIPALQDKSDKTFKDLLPFLQNFSLGGLTQIKNLLKKDDAS